MLNRIDESLQIQETLLEEGNGLDPSGYTYEELGELYLIKGNKDKAKEFFAKAFEVLSKDIWLQKNEKERLDRILRLSK